MSELNWNTAVQAPVSSHQARTELAAVCRLIACEGIAPNAGARVAIRDPEQQGVFFVNPGGLLLREVSASSVVSVDHDRVRLDDRETEPDSGALSLALAALGANSDAIAVAQVASIAGCAVSALRDGLLPMTQTAFMFHNAIGCMEFDPRMSQASLRQKIADEMGGNRALLIRGRGLLVIGKTAAQLWKLVFFLDKCCRSQITAMAAARSGRRSLTIPADDVIQHAVGQSQEFVEHARFVADWPSFLDQLDSQDPSYRD